MNAQARSSSAVRLTTARPGHLQAIIDLEARSFTPTDRFARSTWRHLLGRARVHGSSVTLLAWSEGHVVGALNVLLRRGGVTARLYSLAVDPACRGRGIGRVLVRSVARRLPNSITTLSLEVRHDNAAARSLYERIGFTLHEPLPAYYPDGGDGVRLRAPRATVARGA